jgi:hypothetical protein
MTTEPLNREFDASKFIARYLHAIDELESAADDSARVEWRRVAVQLRTRWKDYNGDDDLHALALGEPAE